MYHSHVSEVADANAGLVGPMIITGKGMSKSDRVADRRRPRTRGRVRGIRRNRRARHPATNIEYVHRGSQGSPIVMDVAWPMRMTKDKAPSPRRRRLVDLRVDVELTAIL